MAQAANVVSKRKWDATARQIQMPERPACNIVNVGPNDAQTKTTIELADSARVSSDGLRSRLYQLTDQLMGNPVSEQPTPPSPVGLNDVLFTVNCQLQDAHDILCKLGSYLGIEV